MMGFTLRRIAVDRVIGRIIAAASLAAAVSSPALAELPFRSDDAFIQGLYHWEGSVAVAAASGSWDRISNRSLTTVIGEFDYGLTDRSEIGVSWDMYKVNSPGLDGMGDLTLHYNHLFWPAHVSRPNVAVDFSVKLPTGSERQGLGTGETDFGVAFVTGWESDRWMTSAELGYVRPGGRSFLSRYEFGVATRYRAAEGVRVLGEAFYDSNEVPNRSYRLTFSGGAEFDLARKTTLFVLLSAGLRETVPDVEARFGARAGI